MKSRRTPKGKSIRTTFFVFCEGETEAAYARYLRARYRLPVVVSVAGHGISEGYISNFRKGKPVATKDRNYLIYDLDDMNVIERLRKIRSAVLIGSDPCVELWFLLHFRDQRGEITSRKCLRLLRSHVPDYRKGDVASLREVLDLHQEEAVSRASTLSIGHNPSTGMPDLIAGLEEECG